MNIKLFDKEASQTLRLSLFISGELSLPKILTDTAS